MLLSILKWHWIQNIEQKNRNMKNQKTEKRKPSFNQKNR